MATKCFAHEKVDPTEQAIQKKRLRNGKSLQGEVLLFSGATLFSSCTTHITFADARSSYNRSYFNSALFANI